MWKTFRAASTGMHSDHDFGSAQQRVFARRKAHVAGQHEFAARAPHATSDLRDADHWRSGETDERIRQDREARRSDGGGDVARLAGQIEVGEVELRVRALEHYDTQARAGVHARKQILEALEYCGVDDVERRIVEH